MLPRPLGESRSVFVFYHQALELLCSPHGPSILTEYRRDSDVPFLSDDSPIGARMRSRPVLLRGRVRSSTSPPHLDDVPYYAQAVYGARILLHRVWSDAWIEGLTPREEHHDAA